MSSPGTTPPVASAHRRWGERFAESCPPLPPLAPDEIERRTGDPTRPLVVGYLSPDLFTHSVAYFIEAPLRHHDPERTRVVVYSCVSRPDETTHRLRRTVEARGHAWHDVGHLPEDLLAELVRQDEVDILVELSGHTAENRLGIVARRPAPIQATWIGYPGSTGLAAVDYLFTDARCVPPGHRWTRPRHRQGCPAASMCFTPPRMRRRRPAPCRSRRRRDVRLVQQPRQDHARRAGGVGQDRRAIQGARIVLKRKPLGSEDARRRLLAAFEALGVGPEG